tara:strand:- start:821 stop:937 length:117 start_codon:yes stop_codon:yes gene_type:complete
MQKIESERITYAISRDLNAMARNPQIRKAIVPIHEVFS